MYIEKKNSFWGIWYPIGRSREVLFNLDFFIQEPLKKRVMVKHVGSANVGKYYKVQNIYMLPAYILSNDSIYLLKLNMCFLLAF